MARKRDQALNGDIWPLEIYRDFVCDALSGPISSRIASGRGLPQSSNSSSQAMASAKVSSEGFGSCLTSLHAAQPPDIVGTLVGKELTRPPVTSPKLSRVNLEK